MKRINLIIIAVLLSLTAFAQHQYDTDFTQTRFMKVSGKTINKAGHLVFDGDEQLSMTYTNPENCFGCYIKYGMRNAMEIASLGCSVNVRLSEDKKTIERCRIAYGVAGPVPMRVPSAEAVVNGKVPRGGYSSVELTYRLSDRKLIKMVLVEPIGTVNTYEIK